MITTETIEGLEAPDLRQHFKHLHWRVMGHSRGAEVASDFSDYPVDHKVFALYKNCGFWTRSEAAILYNVAKQVGGYFLDIGCHTGWTSAHIAAARCLVMAIDPMLCVGEFAARFAENTKEFLGPTFRCFAGRSDQFFDKAGPARLYDGVVIDGDHDRPWPVTDAQNAAKHLKERGVILLHDFWGAPVQEGVTWLMDNGFNTRIYNTPHGVALCWRGDFTPPDHHHDPRVPWGPIRSQANFDFSRTV